MRIRLDRTLCDGFGICAKHAPRHFPLDDWGYASLEGDGVIAPEDHDGVLRALLDCPVHAIIAMREPDAENAPDATPAGRAGARVAQSEADTATPGPETAGHPAADAAAQPSAATVGARAEQPSR